MKNKKKILVLAGLCAAAFCTLNVQASNPQQTYINVDVADNHIPSGAEKVEIDGKGGVDEGHIRHDTEVLYARYNCIENGIIAPCDL